MRRRIVLLLLAFTVFSASGLAQNPDEPPKSGAAAEQQQPPEKKEHATIVDRNVRDVPAVTAKEDCANWAWAAAVEAVLRSDGVREYKQDYWVDKLWGGRCLESAGEPIDLIKALEGEYPIDDGRHVRVTATYAPGLPVNASALLVPLIYDRLQIAFVKGKAMLFTGAQWNEIVGSTGQRTLAVKELRFLDVTKPAAEQKMVIEVGADDLSQVDGIFQIDVSLIQVQN